METINNLVKAFIVESQARNRYTYYAKVAKKEGYMQICNIFLETAEQEKVHAKRLFEHIQELKEGDVVVEASAPLVYGDTKENLKAAIEGETHEFTTMYPEFADKADEEGYEKIAKRLRAIAKAEEHHADRYKKLLKVVEDGSMFKKSDSKKWICQECGYLHEGDEAPEECPACKHPQEYYQIQCEEY